MIIAELKEIETKRIDKFVVVNLSLEDAGDIIQELTQFRSTHQSHLEAMPENIDELCCAIRDALER